MKVQRSVTYDAIASFHLFVVCFFSEQTTVPFLYNFMKGRFVARGAKTQNPTMRNRFTNTRVERGGLGGLKIKKKHGIFLKATTKAKPTLRCIVT